MVSRSWKYATLVLLALLVASNAVLLYNIIDVAITRNYEQQSAEEWRQQASQLEVIANHFVAGKSLDDVGPFLFSTASKDDTFHKPEEHLWWVGNVALMMKDDTTVEALTLGPYDR